MNDARKQLEESIARSVAAGAALMDVMVSHRAIASRSLPALDEFTRQVVTGPPAIARGVKFFPDAMAGVITSLRRTLLDYSAALGRLEKAISDLPRTPPAGSPDC